MAITLLLSVTIAGAQIKNATTETVELDCDDIYFELTNLL